MGHTKRGRRTCQVQNRERLWHFQSETTTNNKPYILHLSLEFLPEYIFQLKNALLVREDESLGEIKILFVFPPEILYFSAT